MQKRKFIITLSVVLLAGVLSYLQWGRDADVFSTFFLIHQKTAVRNTSHFTLNRLVVGDKERRADELIQAYRENGFRSVLFSHDLEKPNALYGTVYRSSVGMKYQEPVFTFRYIQKEGTLGAYNLIDNPEKIYPRYRLTKRRTGQRRAERKAAARPAVAGVAKPRQRHKGLLHIVLDESAESPLRIRHIIEQ